MKLRLLFLSLLCISCSTAVRASRILIPMDSAGQKNHLKAYGIAFAALQEGIPVDWLLNYKGGSFSMENDKDMEVLCRQRGVSYTKLNDKQYAHIVKEIADPGFNGAVVKLEKAPKIAVYTPLNKEPWDDAVTLALTYAQIPFDKLYADEVLAGALDKYDWLHLHHEDFTGQYGKFWGQFQNAEWYKNDQKTMEALAAKNGYKKVSQMQLAVVKKMRDFVGAGGNLFAMCSATETFDIALAAEGTDICSEPFDGDAMDPNAQSKLDFTKCFAFKDFTISSNPYEYTHSTIDNTFTRKIDYVGYDKDTKQLTSNDYFTLPSAPAKFDQVPAMLCQNHTDRIRGFMGQTTAFRKEVIKPDVMILGNGISEGGQDSDNFEARYIHGAYQKGTWTFYGGHDPEAYQHHVGDPVTDLGKYPNSPGYRIILNNVLFPAAKKTVVPTVVVNSKEGSGATTSAEQVVTANHISIYPNPTNDELVISYPRGKVGAVAIINVAGKEVVNYTYNTENVSVNIKDLAPGMYLIKVNGNYAGRVVKE